MADSGVTPSKASRKNQKVGMSGASIGLLLLILSRCACGLETSETKVSVSEGLEMPGFTFS